MTDYFIHPSSILDERVSIGKGSKIWHFCHIMNDVQIGKNCVIGQNVFIGAGVCIGDGVKIQNNVSIFSGVEVDDEVFIGPGAVFTNVYNPRAAVDRKSEIRYTYLKKGVTIGANATIRCGITLETYSFVGAGAVILFDVPAYACMVGNPAVQKGWMSEAGDSLSINENALACCKIDGATYQLIEGKLFKKD